MAGGEAEDMAEYLQRMNKQLEEMTAQHLQVCCRCCSSSCCLPDTVDEWAVSNMFAFQPPHAGASITPSKYHLRLLFPTPLWCSTHNPCTQTMPPKRESLARATALYLERKATSEAGTPLEAGTPVGSGPSRTPSKSPYRSNSTAAVGIRSLPVPALKPASNGIAAAAAGEQQACSAGSPARRLFKNRSEGGLASTTAAAAAAYAASVGAAVAANDAPEDPGHAATAAEAAAAAADGVAEVTVSADADAGLVTPVKPKQQPVEQGPASERGRQQAQTEPRGRRTASFTNRRGGEQQQQQLSPVSSRLFHSPQSSRHASASRRGSEGDSRGAASVKALSAGFDAAAAGGSAGSSVRAYRSTRSEAGAAPGRAAAAGSRTDRSRSGGGGRWQQPGGGLEGLTGRATSSNNSECCGHASGCRCCAAADLGVAGLSPCMSKRVVTADCNTQLQASL